MAARYVAIASASTAVCTEYGVRGSDKSTALLLGRAGATASGGLLSVYERGHPKRYVSTGNRGDAANVPANFSSRVYRRPEVGNEISIYRRGMGVQLGPGLNRQDGQIGS